MKSPLLLSFGTLLLMSSLGCAKTFIPNTEVIDNSENRKIIQFCEDERHAVEEKNIAAILKMTDPAYHEDLGNTNDADDYDFEGFKEILTKEFSRAESIRYERRYRRVTLTESNRVMVDYTYTASFKIPGVSGPEWKHTVADNRLELVHDGESYKIIAGM